MQCFQPQFSDQRIKELPRNDLSLQDGFYFHKHGTRRHDSTILPPLPANYPPPFPPPPLPRLLPLLLGELVVDAPDVLLLTPNLDPAIGAVVFAAVLDNDEGTPLLLQQLRQRLLRV